MCVYIYENVYVYNLYIHIRTYIHIHICIHTRALRREQLNLYAYAHTHTCIHTHYAVLLNGATTRHVIPCVCVYLYIYVYIYVTIYVYTIDIHVCTCIHLDISIHTCAFCREQLNIYAYTHTPRVCSVTQRRDDKSCHLMYVYIFIYICV